MLYKNVGLSEEKEEFVVNCTACMYLNITQNGGTLPFYCPELENVCLCYCTAEFKQYNKEECSKCQTNCITGLSLVKAVEEAKKGERFQIRSNVCVKDIVQMRMDFRNLYKRKKDMSNFVRY